MFEAFGPEHLLPLFKGALWTIVLCVISGVIGSVAGMILGLARTSPSRIARWISDVHDARIELDSAPGRGTRVVVRFPTAREPAPAARDEAMPPGAAGTGSGSLSRS